MTSTGDVRVEGTCLASEEGGGWVSADTLTEKEMRERERPVSGMEYLSHLIRDSLQSVLTSEVGRTDDRGEGWTGAGANSFTRLSFGGLFEKPLCRRRHRHRPQKGSTWDFDRTFWIYSAHVTECGH